ncbi:hypothetical protein F5890DRAFT_1558038 [Lentinula detonsa]|uniref:Uncharacterized protein n=1 Tax=Lentinula detonsa TaxID=2804962 RepID=A0AA38PR37_9AGAR|nr:hypothetical protein F5890DRAFT_1558038 [Lentinula detonsa]
MVRFLSYTALPFGLAFSVTSGAPSRRSMAVLDQRELPDYFAHAGTPSPVSSFDLAIINPESTAIDRHCGLAFRCAGKRIDHPL